MHAEWIRKAIHKGNVDHVRGLVKNQEDFKYLHFNLYSPLALAVRHDQQAIVDDLLARGADVDGNGGLTPLSLTLTNPNPSSRKALDLARTLISHRAHDFDDTQIRDAASFQYHITLLLLIHKEKRELQPSDDMLPWLTKIFGNDLHSVKFLKWWKEQDPVRLAIETKINYIYSLCAQPKSPEELTAIELSNFYERNKN